MTRKRWYNYLIGGVTVLLLTFLLTSVMKPLVSQIHITLSNRGYNNKVLYYVVVNLSFIPILISLSAVIFLYHRYSVEKIYFIRVFRGFLLWMGINLLTLIYAVIIEPETITFNFKPDQFFIFLIISLLLTPIQIFTEELIFRGYILDALKSIPLINRFKVVPVILASLSFALPHMGNPEVGEEKLLFLLVYMTMGLLLSWLTIEYNGLEYAVGIHFANNFFTLNFLNYPDSPLPSSPLFLLNNNVEPLPTLIQSIIVSVIVIIIIKKVETKSVQIKK